MSEIRLDLRELRRRDSRALEELYHIVARSWGRPPAPGEVREIYGQGVRVSVTGGALYEAPELAYALFTERMSRRLPLVWVVRCESGNGLLHPVVIQRHSRERLIVAGSVNRGVFAGLSSTWIVHGCTGPGRYSLGSFVNDAVLAHYRIPKAEAVAQRV